MTSNTPQYYVKVTGGTVNSKTADWLNPGNNTFKPNAKANYTESSWSGQTAEVVGNVRYHKEHVYTSKNVTKNITGPITVAITASDYTEVINQKDRQQYTIQTVEDYGYYRFYRFENNTNGHVDCWYKCDKCGDIHNGMSDAHWSEGDHLQKHVHGTSTTRYWKDIP